MSWKSIIGHESQRHRMATVFIRGKLSGTYLFVGPAGIGKAAFARQLGKTLLCQENLQSAPAQPASPFDSCDHCQWCAQVDAGTHPDLLTISKPAGKNSIPIELLIGDREHRGREGLVHDISLKPFYGGKRIAIIEDAEFLFQDAANALLKTLEEPPPNALLILVGANEKRILPTIRSRSQIIRFHPLTAAQVAELLPARLEISQDEAQRLAVLSGGSIADAMALSDPDVWQFRQQLVEQLSRPDVAADNFSQATIEFVEAAGSDAAAKRDRMRWVAETAIRIHRSQLCRALEVSSDDETELSGVDSAEAVTAPSSLVNMIERSLEVMEQVSANANLTTLIDCWLADLESMAIAGLQTSP